jgi:hypothetical protein
VNDACNIRAVYTVIGAPEQPFSCGKMTNNNINHIDINSSTINNHVILPATSPQSSLQPPSKTIPKENNLILISTRTPTR